MQLALQLVGGRDHRVGSPLRAGLTIAVWPSAEIETPRRGATTVATAGWSAASLDAGDVGPKAGVGGGLRRRVDDDHQRRAGEAGKLRSISFRACTDSEPFACQPAPDSAVSTLGAKKPSPTAINDPGDRDPRT